MASNISTSLIISTYNRSDALELCVKSVLRQSLLPDEIIIADDGSKEDTGELIHQLAASSEVPIIHVWHEDLGFRLASIRNKAIAKASKEYIIQIDGDIVLHKDFVKDHVRFAKKGSFVTGSRVLIREGLTRKDVFGGIGTLNTRHGKRVQMTAVTRQLRYRQIGQLR